MLLWVSLALLTLAVTVLVVRPLLAPRQPALVDDDLARRLAVFRHRRSEIERDRAAGRLAPAEADQAQTDLLHQMAEELPPEALTPASDSASQAAVPRTGRSRLALVTGLALVVFLPLASMLVYRAVGAPEIALAQLDGRLEQLVGADPQAQFDGLMAELEHRLRQNPEDGEAWAVLAEAYKMIGQHGPAIEAFEKAIPLLPPNARLLADQAESTALAAGGDFSGRPTELLEQALAVDADDPKAIALMGAARYRAGALPEARFYLARLLATLPADSEDAARIAEVLARIDGELGARGGAPATAAPGEREPTPPAAGTAATAVVTGEITLAPALAARIAPEAALFVIARAAEGPRIPVAVLRLPVPELPYRFTLGDANAMDPARRLSAAGPLLLEARISQSGDAARQAGDLIAEPVPAKPGETGLALRIDRVVE